MSRHIFFIDPIEKLNIKKDSSLMMALSFQEQGREAFLLMEQDFHYSNTMENRYQLYRFSGEIGADFYIKNFQLNESEKVKMEKGDTFHFRIDPPVDDKYLTYLWLAKELKKSGVSVLNDPEGILRNNEKVLGLEGHSTIPTIITKNISSAVDFCQEQQRTEFIVKPLNSFSGYGVSKIGIDDLKAHLETVFENSNSPIVLQPFLKAVYQGEVRAVYWRGEEIGSIIKTPQSESFLANIAQGAKFGPYELPLAMRKECERVTSILSDQGVHLVAFDILDNRLSEVNITCPGLLVEVSHALGKNLVHRLIEDY
jgi:glutathione synthase